MGSSKKVTVGYRHYMGLHFGICHGPVDEVQEITVGERQAWVGSQTSSGAIGVNAPELFGGDKREGGVYGILDVQMGESTQGTNSYLAGLLGAVIPAFRGILSAVFRGGLVTSNNPYVKPWAFRVKRIVQGWTGGTAWLPDKAPIVFVEPSISDATVRLLTRFAGSSSADISNYAIGAGVLTNPDGVLLSDGSARFGVASGPSPTELSGITWINSNLISTDSISPEMTWEFIFSATTLASYLAMAEIVKIDIGNSSTFSNRQAIIAINGGSSGPANKLDFQTTVPFSINWTSSGAVTTNEGVTSFHVAIQKRSDNHVQIYFNGTRVADFGAVTGFGANEALQSTGFVQIGNYPYQEDWDIKCLGLRVSSRLVYSGATYTVPTPEDLTADFDVVSSGIIAMNPAHIIYECLTDTAWGMGYPASAVDDDSFTASANTLFAENFGLSMLWNRQETIENFIGVVLDHIGGMLYVRPDTGAFALKLIRGDYIRDSLPLYDTSNLISADDYQRQAWGETVNEITVVYTDHASGKETATTVQDAANIMTQGGIVNQTRSYTGIPWPPLAQRVAIRDLNASSTPLAKVKITATRAAWTVFPGDVFRLSWTEFGIDDVVYRALAVNRGTLTDGQIIIDAVEDVFGLPGNTYFPQQPSAWEDPANDPAVAPYRALLEAPYWDLARNLSAADLAYVDSLAGYLETLAVRPSRDALNYAIYARTGSADYTLRGNGNFCPSATINETLTKTTTSITLANGIDLDLVSSGGYAVIGSEYVLVSAINPTLGTATISRAVLDTVPTEHAANSRIWFADGWQGYDPTEAADGEVVDVKLLPSTGKGELPLADATADSITFDQRQYRPYPPGKVRFDSVEWPASITDATDVVLTWAHRDRLTQTAYLVEQSEASIGPEAGVTYSVEVADEALTVLHSATGISGATATVPATALTPGLLRFRLWSVRGGLASWQKHEHWIDWAASLRVTESGEARITESAEYRITE